MTVCCVSYIWVVIQFGDLVVMLKLRKAFLKQLEI